MPEEKTNVMRILEQCGVEYIPHSYPHGKQPVDGTTVARLLGIDPLRVFKTLVTQGNGGCLVFVIPAGASLNLKKAARAAGEKRVELLPLARLTANTGYVRGGCSPIGMKKTYPTFFEETALLWDTILVSAGRIGAQVEAPAEKLASLCGGKFADLAEFA